jgi:protein TonB
MLQRRVKSDDNVHLNDITDLSSPGKPALNLTAMKKITRPFRGLNRKRGLFFQIGMIFSLMITFAAFEWRTVYTHDFDLPETLFEDDIIFEEIVPVHIQRNEPEPPPVRKEPRGFTPVPDPVFIPDPDPEPEPDPRPVVMHVEPKPEPVFHEEPVPVLLGAEVMPVFPGGDAALLNYFRDHIRYPGKAIENRIKGLVFVQLTVGPDGKVTDVVVLRGIGAGCDEEARRVVQDMPDWIPGKQAGRNVAVKLTVPIHFKLL